MSIFKKKKKPNTGNDNNSLNGDFKRVDNDSEKTDDIVARLKMAEKKQKDESSSGSNRSRHRSPCGCW